LVEVDGTQNVETVARQITEIADRRLGKTGS